MRVLVVTSPFGGHEVGHAIADNIDEILAGEHAHHVVLADHPGPKDAVAPIYHPDELSKHETKVMQPDETKEA